MNRTKTISGILNDLAVVRRRSSKIMDNMWEEFSRSQREMVGILVRYPHGTSIKELARVLSVSSSAVTQRVESLEKLDIVQRSMSSHDNRFVSVELTKCGVELLNKKVPVYARHTDKEQFYILNDAELLQFSKLIGKIAHVIEPVQNK
jgi:DNA-binding MarR family transcriptional regulator